MKKINTGIWIDFKDAYIVTLLEDGTSTFTHVASEVEHHAVKGGSRSKTPWGPQHGTKDRSVLEFEKREEGHFFEKVIHLVEPKTDRIVIFGPAEAKTGLHSAFKKIKNFKPELMDPLTADYMTHNEIVAFVKDYCYHGHHPNVHVL